MNVIVDMKSLVIWLNPLLKEVNVLGRIQLHSNRKGGLLCSCVSSRCEEEWLEERCFFVSLKYV